MSRSKIKFMKKLGNMLFISRTFAKYFLYQKSPGKYSIE